jgi:hypothetical protein
MGNLVIWLCQLLMWIATALRSEDVRVYAPAALDYHVGLHPFIHMDRHGFCETSR